MPIFEVEIRGAKYQIDAPDEAQAATQSLKLAQQPQHFELGQAPGDDPSKLPAGTLERDDLFKEFGTGVRQSLEGIPGMGGDIYNLMAAGTKKLASGMPPFVQRHLSEDLDGKNWLPTSQDVQAVTNPIMGEVSDPLTTEGEVARTVGNFGLGLLGPGGPIRKLAQVLLPAGGSEAGGRMAEGTAFEPYARLLGGLIGGGLSVPKVGGKPIKEAAKDLGVKTKDMTRVVRRMQNDGMTPAQIQTRLTELGPDATLMDVGPNLRQEGQRIYAKGGAGRGVIDDVLTPRDKGANQRIRSEIDQNLGPAFEPEMITGSPTNPVGLTGLQRKLGPEYEKVLSNAKAVDTQTIANDLDSMITNERGAAQSSLRELRKMLEVPGAPGNLDPHPRAALATRHAIDGMVASTQDPNVKRVLGAFRRRLDGELTKAAPNIKVVDQKYANLAKQKEAVTQGETALKTGDKAVWPQALERDIAKGGPAIKDRLSQGARAEIEKIVGTKANDRLALRQAIGGEGDWNRDKLGQLFGKDKADRIIAVLDRETTFDATSNRVMKNSATAERLDGENAGFGIREAFMSGGPKSLAYAGIVRGAETVLDKMRGAAAASRDERVARILADTDANKIATALLKANGGKALPAEQIEARVRALLLTPGVAASGRDR